MENPTEEEWAVATPAFCVNVGVAKTNCDRLNDACRGQGVHTRPHMKTHKCVEIGALQTAGTTRSEARIAVSTVLEAEVFAGAGYCDVICAVPVEKSKLDRLYALHSRLPALSVMIDSHAHVELLEAYCAGRLSDAVGRVGAADGSDGEGASLLLAARRLLVWVSVDAGYGREGAAPPLAVEVGAAVHASRRLRLAGVYSHSGNAYNCPGCPEEARTGAQGVGAEEARTVADVAAALARAGVPVPCVSVGATPSVFAGAVWSTSMAASAAPALPPGTRFELHAGNYPFLDRQQVASGSGRMEDVAVYVLSRVIGVYPHRNGGEFLIDAGGTALHKDTGGLLDWGCLGEDNTLVLRKMTQEVSVVGRVAGDDRPIDWGLYPLGGLVRVLPNHSCMTAAMHARYVTVEGPGPGTLHGKPELARDIKVTGSMTPCKYW